MFALSSFLFRLQFDRGFLSVVGPCYLFLFPLKVSAQPVMINWINIILQVSLFQLAIFYVADFQIKTHGLEPPSELAAIPLNDGPQDNIYFYTAPGTLNSPSGAQ